MEDISASFGAVAVCDEIAPLEEKVEDVEAPAVKPKAKKGPNKLSKSMSSNDVVIRGSTVACTGQQLGNGWRMVRALHGFPCSAVPDAVYFEFTLTVSGNARVGWSRMDANVDANVGFCKFSFGYRDVDGSLFHESKGRPYGVPWSNGDVIGCMMWQSGGDDFGMMFFKNGVPQPKVELRVPSGIYYPSVSLYSNASGTVQLGPEFAFPPSASVCPVQWGGAHLLDGSTLGKLFVSSLKEESKRVRSDEPARDEGFEHDLAQKRSKSFVQDGVDEAEIMVPTATAEVAVQPANPVVEVKLRSVTDDALLNVSLAKTSFWRD